MTGRDVLLTALAGAAGIALGPVLQRATGRLTSGGPLRPDVPRASVPVLVPAGPAVTRRAAPAGAATGVGSHSPSRRLAMPILAGSLFAATAARFGADPVLPGYLYLAAVGLLLAAVDLRSHRLPNALTLPAYPITVVLLAAAALLGSPSGSLPGALAGGAASYLLYLAVRFVSPRGLGFGDVKLAGVLGLYTGWLGWDTWTVGLLAAWLYAGTIGLALLMLRRVDRRAHLAMGPYLLAGTLTAILVGQQLLARATL